MRKLAILLVFLAGCAATDQRAEQLAEERLAAIRNGMSVQEVEGLLGMPDGGIATYATGETVAGWQLPVRMAGIRIAYFNVHYRDGRVVRTTRSYDYMNE